LHGDGRVTYNGRNVRQLPVASSPVLRSDTAIGVPCGTSSGRLIEMVMIASPH
jgi:hypothetical protein